MSASVGVRIEHAIEERTELEPDRPPPKRLWRTVFWLAVTGVSLYLVALAFCGAQVLAQTPGGLGFAEAGLTAMLALAGVSPGDAVLATFAYRLFSTGCRCRSGWWGLALNPRGTAAPPQPVG